MRKITCVVLFLGLFGQSQTQKLEEVIINAQRLSSAVKPLSISFATDSLSVLFQQEIGSVLTNIPGLFVSSQQNFSQDTRIAIRGFGTRASFGIRGIKVLLDGIPLTTPDGQTQLDHIPLTQLGEIEILRGLSSGLYGNASGGVLLLKSKPILNQKKLFTSIGQYGARSIITQIESSKEKNKFRVIIENKKQDGYRQWSSFENTTFSLTDKVNLNKGGSLEINYSLFTSPFARDAGGLTIEEVNNNRKQVRDANFNYKAGERILNHFLSLRIKRNKWSGYSFYTNRQLDARLPFNYGGQINLNRNYFGGGFYKDGSKKNFIWQYGLDSAFQFDKRKRFKNNNGAKGDLSLYQKESFITFGGYGILEIIKKKWRLRGIIRADKHYILINDYFASNNGENNISVLSPSISLYRKISSKWSVYFQYSTGYETPSLNELSANPTGETGFNKRLKPQQSKGTELGFNYKTKNSKTQLIIFHTKTSNEIIPYEVANFAGQTFYTNAGLVNRSGIEIESTWAFSDFGKLQLSFNHGKFETNLKKVLPNVPRIQFNSSLKQQLGSSTIVLQIRHVGKRYADSKNTVDVPSFWTEDLFIQRSLGNTIWTVGVTNFSNVKYYDNIRINAFGGRYFEPAATRLAFIRCLISI